MNVIDDAALAAAIKSVTDPLLDRIEALEAKVADQVTQLEVQTFRDVREVLDKVLTTVGPRIDAAQASIDKLLVLVASVFSSVKS